MIGSRFVDWLHPSSRALPESGYWSGVVASFSINVPSTRPSVTEIIRSAGAGAGDDDLVAGEDGVVDAVRPAVGGRQRRPGDIEVVGDALHGVAGLHHVGRTAVGSRGCGGGCGGRGGVRAAVVSVVSTTGSPAESGGIFSTVPGNGNSLGPGLAWLYAAIRSQDSQPSFLATAIGKSPNTIEYDDSPGMAAGLFADRPRRRSTGSSWWGGWRNTVGSPSGFNDVSDVSSSDPLQAASASTATKAQAANDIFVRMGGQRRAYDPGLRTPPPALRPGAGPSAGSAPAARSRPSATGRRPPRRPVLRRWPTR